MMLNLMASLRQMKLFSQYRTREITKKVKLLKCPERHTNVAVKTICADYLAKKVCVPCAVNRKGVSVAKVTNLGRVSTQDLHNLFDG